MNHYTAAARSPIKVRLLAGKRNIGSPIITRFARIKAQYGYALLWDAHSIQSRVPRFFDGQLPGLNLGTGNGTSCPGHIAQKLLSIANESQYEAVLNGRFKGGYITRNYGDPANNIHAVQLEISQITYMDEAPLFRFQEAKAERLRPVLRAMVAAFCASFDGSRP